MDIPLNIFFSVPFNIHAVFKFVSRLFFVKLIIFCMACLFAGVFGGKSVG